MNRLLGIVMDVEYLYTCVHKEEDADTKQVYFSLFKVSFVFTVTQHVTKQNFLLREIEIFCISVAEKIHPVDG